MSSKVSTGYGLVVSRKGEKLFKSNYSIPTKIKEFLLNIYMNNYRLNAGGYNNVGFASPLFNRYNRKRYESSALKIAATMEMDDLYANWHTYYQDTAASRDWYRNRYYFSNSLVEANNCAAISSVGVSWKPINGSIWSYNVPPFLPDSGYANVLLTNIDVPGTEIGPTYKHEIGTVQIFDDAGDTPSSQGDIIFSGTFDPPEGLEGSFTIQVYFASSGGTGTIDSGIGTQTNGQLSAGGGSDDLFTDLSSGGHLAGDASDVGRFIAVYKSGVRRGIYEITSFIDTNSCRVDTKQVNEPVGSTESPLEWTVRDGPIGEYFFRVRPYTHGTVWSSSYVGSNSSYLGLNHMGHEFGDLDNSLSQARRYIYDRGGSWWWILKHPTDNEEYGLMRWCRMSPSGVDPVYKNGDIIGGMPTDLFNWSDIAIDDDDKLWIGVEDATTSTDRLFNVDPYPGTPPDASAPELLDSWGKQTDAATADGLTAETVLGICCDDSQAIAAGTRTWVFCGDDGTTEGEGGISYTDDYGTTWKRIHILHSIAGETLTVSNGSPNVTAGTSLDTKFAVGDWIRFGSDTRSYEVQARTATTMTLTENYQGTGGSYSVQKGALTTNEAVLLNVGHYVHAGGPSFDFTHQPPCDYDSNGNLYWIPSSRDRICKWDESTGAVSIATASDLGQSLTFTNPTNLKVSRVPDIAGSGDSIWHDNIWIGCFGTTTNNGWVRIQNENFEYVNDTGSIDSIADLGGTPNKVRVTTSSAHGLVDGVELEITGAGSYNGFYVIENASGSTFDIVSPTYGTSTGTWTVVVTRYHYSLTDNFPKTMDIAYTDAYQSGWNIIVEPKTGQIYLTSWGGPGITQTRRQYAINQHDGSVITAASTGIYSAWNSTYNTGGALDVMNFDDVGIGSLLFMPADYMYNNFGYQPTSATFAPLWICRRWDGSQWLMGPMNQISADIDFNGTPKVENVPTVGSGLRRVHDWDEELWAGVNVRFDQNGAATPQTSEYIADESATTTCYIGTGKDNLAQATWNVDAYSIPTVYRLDEAIKDITNQWTSDGGIDGGYKESGAVSDVLSFSRGPAENHFLNGQGNTPYWKTDDWQMGTPDIFQLIAALRIADEHELDTDGIIAPGSNLDRFQSTGYSFTADDVGKSIITEGYTGANNGQFVITDSVPTATWPASTVTVTPNFNANEPAAAGKRWKLRDIPPVGYVALQVYYSTYPYKPAAEIDYKLLSSDDYGATYTQRKHIESIHAKAVNASLVQDNCFFCTGEYGNVFETGFDGTSVSKSFTVFFRLTDLDTDSRRRQYWKIFKDRIGSSNDHFRVAGIMLFDDNFNILGRASDHKVDDADNSLFSSCLVGKAMFVPYASTTAGQPTGSGDVTDLITAGSESFYEHDGTNTGTISGGNTLTVTGYYFSQKDVGKYIRIDETGYADNGFHVITSVNSTSQVTLGSTGMTNQSNLDWQLLTFGPGDFVRFTSDTLYSHREGTELEDIYYEILDVPSNTTIQLASAELPVQIAGSSWSSNFDINRTPEKTGYNTQYSDFETGGYFSYDPKFGTLWYSQNTEFVEIESGTSSTSTKEWGGAATDNDGDGRVDAVNIGTVLTGDDGTWTAVADNGSGKARFTTGAVHALSVGDYVTLYDGPDYDGSYKVLAVSDTTHFDLDVTYAASTDTGKWSSEIGPGDYVLLTGSSNYGRRVLEIRDITRNASDTDVRFTYDELYPSDTFTNWYIYTRREWLRAANRRTITILNETPTP